MLPTHEAHTRFGLVRDMLATPSIVGGFDADQAIDTAQAIARTGRLLLTGEGSSRLFPAKNAIVHARRCNWPIQLHTEAARQAAEFDLTDWAVFALSNSGRTAEVIALFQQLQALGHSPRYSLTAASGSRLESLATRGYVLSCGAESAVAATKSVIEQALFNRALLEHAAGQPLLAGRLGDLSLQVHEALTFPIDPAIIGRIAAARTIYWAGRNDGVAEELTLKTNEITRKTADFLEGTYALHGVEEVMDAGDVLIWMEPFAGTEAKIQTTLVEGVGLTVVAISTRSTPFPTILIPDAGDLDGFVQMACGWNLLVDVGLQLGIDIDKPQRARKVGNEFLEG
jgi:glucosamine--fructose-6-phosphate aminotransferase (isomerizing)